MHYVYVIQTVNAPEQFYTGITEDINGRLKDHNAGEVFHTAKFKPWLMKNYFAFTDSRKAFAFERYLKSGSGRSFAKRHF